MQLPYRYLCAALHSSGSARNVIAGRSVSEKGAAVVELSSTLGGPVGQEIMRYFVEGQSFLEGRAGRQKGAGTLSAAHW